MHNLAPTFFDSPPSSADGKLCVEWGAVCAQTAQSNAELAAAQLARLGESTHWILCANGASQLALRKKVAQSRPLCVQPGRRAREPASSSWRRFSTEFAAADGWPMTWSRPAGRRLQTPPWRAELAAQPTGEHPLASIVRTGERLPAPKRAGGRPQAGSCVPTGNHALRGRAALTSSARSPFVGARAAPDAMEAAEAAEAPLLGLPASRDLMAPSVRPARSPRPHGPHAFPGATPRVSWRALESFVFRLTSAQELQETSRIGPATSSSSARLGCAPGQVRKRQSARESSKWFTSGLGLKFNWLAQLDRCAAGLVFERAAAQRKRLMKVR